MNQSERHFVRDGQTSLLRIGPGRGRVLGFQSGFHEKALNKGKHEIQDIANRLAIRPREEVTQTAHRFYMIAMERNFIRGRSTLRVAGACLYIVCRQENKPYMLIDFSDCLQTNVYVLGAVFLQLCQLLRLEQHPIMQKPVDPSLFIHRFADRLQFGEKMHTVANTALRLVDSMKRDWMQTGRRPSGVCGAALFIAAHIHGFERSKADVVSVVHICEATLKTRHIEFGKTDSGSLTTTEFDVKAKEVDFQIRTGLLSSQIEGKGPTLIICQHKETGGMEGGSAPPAFQRAEQQRLKEAGKGSAAKGGVIWERHEGPGAEEIPVLTSCDKMHILWRGDGSGHFQDANFRKCRSKQTARRGVQCEKDSDIEVEGALKKVGVDSSRSAVAIDKQWRMWKKLWKQKGVDERRGESEDESVSDESVEDEELSGEGIGGGRGRGQGQGRVQGRGKLKVEDTEDMYRSILPPSQSTYASHDKDVITAMDSTDAPAVRHDDCEGHRAGSGYPAATAREAIVSVPVLVKRQLEIISQRRGGVKIVVTSDNEGEGAQESNEQQGEPLTLDKESLEENSETLSDIDDDQLNGYFHNDEEVRLKTIIWTEMNKEYLKEQEAKHKVTAVSDAGRTAAFGIAATNCSSAVDIAATNCSSAVDIAAAVSKLKKKRIDNAKTSPATTAADATRQMLTSKKLSSKVNYAVLARLFDAGNADQFQDVHSSGEKVTKKKENVGEPVPLRTPKRKRKQHSQRRSSNSRFLMYRSRKKEVRKLHRQNKDITTSIGKFFPPLMARMLTTKRTTMKTRDLFFVLIADVVIPNFIQGGFLTHSSNPELTQNLETGKWTLVIGASVNRSLVN